MAHGNEESAPNEHAGNNGDRVVGGTLRADGSVRKTIKVRPGFTPAEEVKKYDVRERMQRRQEERSAKPNREDENERKPGTRPNRQFGAINNILQTSQRSARETIDKSSIKTSKDKSDINLEESLGKLSLESKESKDKLDKIPKDSKNSDSKIQNSTTPKKYIPPSRRNKPIDPESK